MWWPWLMAACALAAFKAPRAGVCFVTPLIMAVTLMSVNPPYTALWFFAIYAGTGALLFFLYDWVIGALLTVVSLASGAHAAGIISALHRDIAGEVLFLLGLAVATFVGPSRPILRGSVRFDFGGRYRVDNRRWHIDPPS